MTDPDFDALAADAVDLLQRYIRVDTTNPPGNETLAAAFLEVLLRKEGVETCRFEGTPGRANLIATLAAEAPEGKPLVFLNHTDVVPAEAAHWEVPPFDGILKDGFVWGQGALDMKGMAAVALMALQH